MDTPVVLKIILTDGNSQRLTLPNGIPETIDDLMIEVARQCRLEGRFKLQFMDHLFGNDFLNLTSITEVEDRGTLRVIDLENSSSVEQQPTSFSQVSQCHSSPLTTSFSSDVSFQSDGSADTDILSSTESSSSRSSWPEVFHVPKFSHDVEIQLQQGNLKYAQDATFLVPDVKLKSAILDGLLQKMVQYKVYVTSVEMEQVALSLIKTHPCLKEQGSKTGCGGWKKSLLYKISNYRTHLRKIGCPEVTINTIKNKPDGKRTAAFAAFGVKKPKRAEVNFCPTYAKESEETLEEMQKSLLLDIKKKKKTFVKMKMERTFPLRRHEVVRDAPMVEHFMARWPALFEVSEINAEFQRITTVPLESRFLLQLDIFSGKFQELFKRRGGQVGEQLRKINGQLSDCADVDTGRECILQGICIYMGEYLIQEYVDIDENAIEEAIEETIVGVYHCKSHPSHEDNIGVVLEGVKVLEDLDNVPMAVMMLFGLLYCLNISYPSNLRYTFEVLQKIIMELDGSKLSNKALGLKNKLFQ